MGGYAVIGVTCCNMEEAENAFKHGADYLGIGTMFPTPTNQSAEAAIPSHTIWAFKVMGKINRHKVHSRHSRNKGDPQIHRRLRGRYPRRCH